KLPLVWCFVVLRFQGFNFFTTREGEYTRELFHILIGGVEPELVKLIGGSTLGVQPHIAAFGFPEFGAIGLGDEPGGNGECFTASDPPDQLGPRNNLAPLIGAAHLDQAVSVLPEMVKIVPLQ